MNETPTVRVANIDEFRPQKKNANRHKPRGVSMLEKTMRRDGYVAPITATADGEVIDGSLRLETSADVFGDEVLVVEHDGTRPIVMKRTDIPNAGVSIAKHISVSANRIAQVDLDWDEETLDEIRRTDEEALEDLFTDEEINKMLKDANKPPVEKTSLEQVEGELPGVKALKDYPFFPTDLPYDFPSLRADMILEMPSTIQTWAGPNVKYPEENPGWWFYIWGSDSIRTLNLPRTVVGFYTFDYKFDMFWSEPAQYTGKLINAGLIGAIMPNFSMYEDMPKIMRMWQRFRSLWVGRYLQEAGIRILPDIQLSEADGELCWIGVPVGVPVAIQFHTKLGDEGWRKEKDFLKETLAYLKPPRIFVYADEKGWRQLGTDGLTGNMIWVKNRVSVRRPYMDSVSKEKL